MTQTFQDTTTLYIRIPHGGRLLEWVEGVAAGLQLRLALARARKVVRTLDDAQLADAGIDVSMILPPRPTISIEAGLMARLMSMR